VVRCLAADFADLNKAATDSHGSRKRKEHDWPQISQIFADQNERSLITETIQRYWFRN
jgi:hypothetical protein